MKPLFFPLIMSLSLMADAQDYYSKDSSKVYAKEKDTEQETVKRAYMGFGMGINNDAGLVGFAGKVRVYHKLFVRGAVGRGTWGNKVTIGAQYEMKYTRCWGFGITYSHCSGIRDFVTTLDTVPAGPKEVTLDLLPAGALNLTSSYNLYFKRNKLFYMEFGYSFPLAFEPFTVKDGSQLTADSKAVLSLIQPGGIYMGVGFMFGF